MREAEDITVLEMAHSPFCIPITRALEACGREFERETIPNHDRTRVIEITDGNYYGVPVLVHGDRVVWESSDDSQDIARYIDENFGGGRMFPSERDGLQDILIRYLENEVELTTFQLVDRLYVDSIEPLAARTMTIRHKERKFGRGCIEKWKANADTQRLVAEMHFDRFDNMLSASPFLLGDNPHYTDFLLFGILGNYTYKDYNALPQRMTALADWRTRMTEFRFDGAG